MMTKLMSGSWKTTLSGILTVVFGLVSMKWPSVGAPLMALAIAVGLMKARDDDKSSEDVGAAK